MQRQMITRRTLVSRWTAWAAAAGIAGAQSRPQASSQLESTAARRLDERARSLDTFEVPKETEPAFVFQP
jgi:hypothetical protein